MRKLLYILALVCVSAIGAKGQSFYTTTEYGFSVGGSQYFGDLNDRYGFKTPNAAVGAYTRIHMNPYIAVRIGANLTRISYDDKLSTSVFNKKRNLNFSSNIAEAALFMEFNFFRFMTGDEKSRWTPYLVGGAGIFYFDPTTKLDGRTYHLRDLGTEGQFAGYGDRGYSNFSFMFPVGAGFKYWLKPGVNFSFEISDRLTMTDYLDDVSTTYVGKENFESVSGTKSASYALQDRSTELGGDALGRAGKQRGNSGSKDQYLMVSFTISFQLKTYRCPAYINNGIMY